MSRRALMLIVVGLAASAAAEVDDPHRMVDRVFFGVYGGVGQVTARSLTGPGQAGSRSGSGRSTSSAST